MSVRLNIIGCGRAAGSMARLWLQAGLVELGHIINRSAESTAAAVEKLQAGTAATSVAEMGSADLWLIGTGDDQIEDAARRLAEEGAKLTGSVAFHLAGRFGIEVLAALKPRGCELAAVHPVRSLTHARLGLADFAGTSCVAGGDSEALTRLKPLITGIGGNWVAVQDIDRGLYHAALSIISNITKGVAWRAQNWLVHSGLPEETSMAVTAQLLETTLEDITRSGAQQTITGPIVRGDTSTIEAHLAALESMSEDDLEVYRVLARTVVELAADRGDLDARTLGRFEQLLCGGHRC